MPPLPTFADPTTKKNEYPPLLLFPGIEIVFLWSREVKASTAIAAQGESCSRSELQGRLIQAADSGLRLSARCPAAQSTGRSELIQTRPLG